MSEHVKICEEFCARLQADMEARGPNEDALKPLVSTLVESFAAMHGIGKLRVTTEEHLGEHGVRPDISIYINGLICGYVELKAPGTGADVSRFKGHNREQATRLLNLPNLIYTDGQEWALYHGGEQPPEIIRFPEDMGGKHAPRADEDSSRKLDALLQEFLKWDPIVPHDPEGLANFLAPLARILREEADTALQREDSLVSQLREDLGRFFMPDIRGGNFADSVAQTATYSLLLARLSDATDLTFSGAAKQLRKPHPVLATSLEYFARAEKELRAGSSLLRRALENLNVFDFAKSTESDGRNTGRGRGKKTDGHAEGSQMDIYFYEHFLAAYDPELRKRAGVYYTPKQVVKLQVRLADRLLREKFEKTDGIGDSRVTILDPAVGTGAYLMESMRLGTEKMAERYGPGMRIGTAREMLCRMYGIELLPGPYAVAHLQLSKAFRLMQPEEEWHPRPKTRIRKKMLDAQQGEEVDPRPQIYLADTLSSPHKETPGGFTLAYQAWTQEYENARRIKNEGDILICIGNPPYGRHASAEQRGGWVRYGDDDNGNSNSHKQGEPPILEDFLKPARESGHGGDLPSLYNDYVYFWRWALWRLFERQECGGIVSFITASSYLRGPGFVGMREVMRQTFDELWILDLEGDNRGTRQTENVFNIQTPVAIAIGYRKSRLPSTDEWYPTGFREEPPEEEPKTPARVYYAKLPDVPREAKLEMLSQIETPGKNKTLSLSQEQGELGKPFSSFFLEWRECPADWQAPFMPEGEGSFFAWPQLPDLFPWNHPGAKFHRAWPIGETEELLRKRWKALVSAPPEKRAELFRESGDRTISFSTKMKIPGGNQPSIEELNRNAPMPKIRSYSFRSLDRQLALDDIRLCDRPRLPLRQSISEKQIFLITLQAIPLGEGPAVSIAPHLPDMSCFRGSFGGAVFPLYRDKHGKEANITEGLLPQLSKQYGRRVTPEDLAAYVAAILGGQKYTDLFREELTTPGPRIPLTKDGALFRKAAKLGSRLIWLHSYAQRFRNEKQKRGGAIPRGKAGIVAVVPNTEQGYPREFLYKEGAKEIHIGEGRVGPVKPEVWNYEISGLKPVQSWLGYRKFEPSGRKSSELDAIRPQIWSGDMTRQFLELLWVIEATLKMEPALAAALDEIIAAPCLSATDLPQPTPPQKRPPATEQEDGALIRLCTP